LQSILLNSNGKVPLHERFRALFTLKSLKSPEAIEIISKGFADPSALLKHELAYCLGQMANPCALPALKQVLADTQEDPMVRHEAAEAMGAISDPSSLAVLREYLLDPQRVVRETCEIAVAKIEWDNSEEGKAEKNLKPPGSIAYTSIDPAPPSHSGLISSQPSASPNAHPKFGSAISPWTTVPSLRATLLDTQIPLFERYRAMFALRNIGTPEAVDALADGFTDDSALFKHEIAFVFGQLLSPHSVPALLKVLENRSESDMVRHEAAEALGGIATPEVLPVLLKMRDAPEDGKDGVPQVVRESCQVACDMWEYENSGEFQYANGLTKVTSVEA